MNADTKLVWNGDKAILAAHDVARKSAFEMAIIMSNDAKLLCNANTGILRSSIMIRDKETISKGSGTFQLISQPIGDAVHVGTAIPYATYVEYGTAAHKTANKSEQFVASITEWAKKKGIKNVGGLIRSIRRRGTKPHPFMRPAFDRISGKSIELTKVKVRDHFEIIMAKYLGKKT